MRPIRAVASGITRVRVINLREIRSHRLRVITSMLVVVVSSGLLVAVLGAYGSLTASISDFNAGISGAAQLEVAAIADSGVDQHLAGAIRAEAPDAQAVVPLIRGSVDIKGKPVPLLGSDQRVTALSGQLRATVTDRAIDLDDLASGVFVGPGTGLRVNQRVQINGIDVHVIDVLSDPQAAGLNKGRFVFAYLDLAQRLTGLDGRLDSILIVAKPGADHGALRAQVERVVDGRAAVVDPDFRTRQTELASSVTRDPTLLISLVSLIIAAFLVFNTMTMAVASRRDSLAMIRALGGRRLHLVGDMLGEAALFGFVGGVIGVPVGILAGRWAISRIPEQSVDSIGAVVDYHLPVYAPFVAVAACVFACVAATALAARSVFSMSPVEAMAPGEIGETGSRRNLLGWASGIAGVALMIGAWVMVYTVPGRPAILAGAIFAGGALLLCFALTAPLVWCVVRVSRLFGGPGRLASVNTERAPRRAWATLMTVAVAIAVGMGTSGALDNLVSSISSSLDGIGDPDFYVSSQSKDSVPLGPILPAGVRDEVAEVPGVAEVVGGQWSSVNIGENRALIQGLVPGSRAPFMRKASDGAVRQVLAGDGILLSNVLSRTMGVHTGDTVRMATPTGYHELVVRDTVEYVSIDSGVAAVSSQLLARWFDRPGDTYLQVMVAPDADRDAVRDRMQQIVARYPTTGNKPINVYTGAEALAATQSSAEQSGAFTVAIQWIVALAAAVALLNTLLLSVIERRRELGVLRAMGASRRFVSRMVLAEAAAVALVGAAVGVVLGTALHLLTDEILSATTGIDIIYEPRPSIVVFVATAVGLCLVGAFLPAVRAARMNISESILTD